MISASKDWVSLLELICTVFSCGMKSRAMPLANRLLVGSSLVKHAAGNRVGVRLDLAARYFPFPQGDYSQATGNSGVVSLARSPSVLPDIAGHGFEPPAEVQYPVADFNLSCQVARAAPGLM